MWNITLLDFEIMWMLVRVLGTWRIVTYLLLVEVSSIVRVACSHELSLVAYHLSPVFSVKSKLPDLFK